MSIIEAFIVKGIILFVFVNILGLIMVIKLIKIVIKKSSVKEICVQAFQIILLFVLFSLAFFLMW